MGRPKKKKEDELKSLIEQKVLERLKAEDSGRMDIKNAIDFLKVRDSLGVEFGGGFRDLPPDELGDPEDPSQPDYTPSPLTSLADEETDGTE